MIAAVILIALAAFVCGYSFARLTEEARHA